MRPPRFHPEARRDFDDAFDFLAERSPSAADRFGLRVAEAIDLISAFPKIGRLLAGPFRAVSVDPFPYRLVYRTEADGHTTVLAIAHDRRRPEYWRHRSE